MQQPQQAVRVVVRIRPSEGSKCLEYDDEAITIKSGTHHPQVGNPQSPSSPVAKTPGGGPRNAMTPQAKRPSRRSANRYLFDSVHGPEATQLEMFAHARELVAGKLRPAS